MRMDTECFCGRLSGGANLVHSGISPSQNCEKENLSNQSCTAVKNNVPEGSGARRQKTLMKLIDGRNQRRTNKRKCGPFQAPSRAQPWKCGTPRSKQENAKCEVTDKVPGLAKQSMPDCESLGTHSEEIMKDGIEYPPSMVRRTQVRGFRDDDRQPNGRW
jgi:hypothetical protein